MKVPSSITYQVTQFMGSGAGWSLVATVGNTFATGLSAIALLLLFRLLGPAEAGSFSVILAMSMLLAKIGDFGINAALIKAVGKHNEVELHQTIQQEALRLKRFATLLIFIAILLIGGWFVVYVGYPIWQLLAVLVGTITMIWYEHLVFMAQSQKAVLSTVIINALQAGTKLLLVFILTLVGAISLLTGTTLFVLAPIVPLLFWQQLVPARFGSKLNSKTDDKNTHVLPIMKHTAFLAVATGLLENSDVLFVQRFVSANETGLFAGAWRIASLFILIGYSLASVLNPRVSRYHGKADQKSYVLKALALSGALLLSFAIAFPFLPLLIKVTIGEQYMASLPVLAPLLFAAFLSLATVPLTALFYQLKADWFFSVTAVGQLIILAVGYGVFLPEVGIGAAGLTRLAAHGLAFILALLVVLWTMVRQPSNNSTEVLQS